jgi:hypothetical protein
MSDSTVKSPADFDRPAAVAKARATIKRTQGDEVAKRIAALQELKGDYPELPDEAAEQLMVEAAESMGRRGKIVWANEYALRNVRWLWQNRIPLGMLSGLYGVEGMGKSMETARIAAAVTRGDLPGALEGVPRRVLIATTEDGWRETIAPRLKAAGADMSMVGHYRITEDGSDESPELPRDADVLAEDVRGHEVALVILDPVVSHLDDRAESHKTKDVRKALEPLHRVAEQEGFAVLGIMHFNKEKSSDTRQRSQMSSAFREVFRSTLVFGPDPDALDDKTRRVVALDKNNLVAPQPSYRMQIENVTLDETDPDSGEPIRTAKIILGDECSYTANELLEAAAGSRPKGVSEQADQARRFLRDRIEAGGGATPVSETKREAAAAGISTTALDKARGALKLGARRIEGGMGYEWYSRAEAGEELEF